MELTTLQKVALDLLIEGKNVFITGPSGTGKSSVIHYFMKKHGHSKKIALTSTTGISAILIGGVTLHSYLGIGLGTASVEELHTIISSKSKTLHKWKTIDVLVIDEVSMLSPQLFDKLETLARLFRKNDKPFGGIQLVLSGDFLQLPVVKSDDFVFESKAWERCINHVIELTEIIRQSDPEFQNVLNDLRYGMLTDRAKNLLDSRIGAELTTVDGILPTKIYTTNMSVDMINEQELDKLSKDNVFFQYDVEITFLTFQQNREQACEKYRKNCLAPASLQLCKGAQVMLVANISVETGLANGSRGVVVDFLDDLPLVRFLDGNEHLISYYTWEIEEDRKKIARITQIPLKLAWAVTVHKCVHEDTFIFTNFGIKRIKDLSHAGQNIGEIKELDIDVFGSKSLEQATQIFKGKVEKTIILKTINGYELQGSFRHPVLTDKGWKLLPDIREGDTVVVRKNMHCFGDHVNVDSIVVDQKLCWLLGILCRYGYCNLFKKWCVEIPLELVEKVRDCVQVVFGIQSRIYGNTIIFDNQKLTDFFTRCGLREFDRSIPWVVLQNTECCQKEFVKGLGDNFSTEYEQLAKDYQNLLLNFGTMTNRYKKEIFHVEIVEEKNDEFFEVVTRVSESFGQVYDLYVPGTHTFIGNGMVNHNSQGCTLDFAEVDLSNTFAFGQAYVALSRVKSKDSLSIIGINYEGIQAHPKAKDFYKNLKI